MTTPLRDNLNRAKQAYEAGRYPGSLALDVLGAPARRRNVLPLAIAAALAAGLTVGIFAGLAMRPANSQLATTQATESAPRVVEAPTPTAEQREVAVASREDGTFSIVPTSAFTTESISVVPDLASLTAEAATGDATTGASDLMASTSFVPTSLMLLSADEYAAQQSALDAATSTDPSSSSSTSSEEPS